MTEDATGTEGPVSLVDLIDALAEPPEPAPIPLTPETWGWAALAGLAAVLLAIGLWRWFVRHRANAYRRVALAELARAKTVAELAAILRRAALAAWPRPEVAALTGNAWTAFLSRTGRRALPDAAAEELQVRPYRDGMAAPSAGLRCAAEDWLRAHRVTQATAASKAKVPEAAP